MLQEERSEQSESEAGKEKWKGNKKRVYPSLGELRKELKEPGEDSESEEDIYEDEDLTEDEEGEIVELMEKHSLKVPEKQCPKMATVKSKQNSHQKNFKWLKDILSHQGYANPNDSNTILHLSEWLRSKTLNTAYFGEDKEYGECLTHILSSRGSHDDSTLPTPPRFSSSHRPEYLAALLATVFYSSAHKRDKCTEAIIIKQLS
ncbi:hypothetical protein H671_6g15279 [Cricetulus griseus]|nr:hypothetical protein H671_6g15279 [Cricetulus griseus]